MTIQKYGCNKKGFQGIYADSLSRPPPLPLRFYPHYTNGSVVHALLTPLLVRPLKKKLFLCVSSPRVSVNNLTFRSSPSVHPFFWYEHKGGRLIFREKLPLSSTSLLLPSYGTNKSVSFNIILNNPPYLDQPGD